MDFIKQRANNLRPHLNKRIWTRLLLYFAISVILFIVTIFSAVRHDIFFGYVLAGLVIGSLLGIFLSRINKLSWDNNAEHIISQLDLYGGILLVVYILFEVFREKIVEQFVPEPVVSTVGFALLAGIIYGRFLGMRGKIFKILREQGISK